MGRHHHRIRRRPDHRRSACPPRPKIWVYLPATRRNDSPSALDEARLLGASSTVVAVLRRVLRNDGGVVLLRRSTTSVDAGQSRSTASRRFAPDERIRAGRGDRQGRRQRGGLAARRARDRRVSPQDGGLTVEVRVDATRSSSIKNETGPRHSARRERGLRPSPESAEPIHALSARWSGRLPASAIILTHPVALLAGRRHGRRTSPTTGWRPATSFLDFVEDLAAVEERGRVARDRSRARARTVSSARRHLGPRPCAMATISPRCVIASTLLGSRLSTAW